MRKELVKKRKPLFEKICCFLAKKEKKKKRKKNFIKNSFTFYLSQLILSISKEFYIEIKTKSIYRTFAIKMDGLLSMKLWY